VLSPLGEDRITTFSHTSVNTTTEGAFGAMWIVKSRPGYKLTQLFSEHKKFEISKSRPSRRALAADHKINFDRPYSSGSTRHFFSTGTVAFLTNVWIFCMFFKSAIVQRKVRSQKHWQHAVVVPAQCCSFQRTTLNSLRNYT